MPLPPKLLGGNNGRLRSLASPRTPGQNWKKDRWKAIRISGWIPKRSLYTPHYQSKPSTEASERVSWRLLRVQARTCLNAPGWTDGFRIGSTAAWSEKITPYHIYTGYRSTELALKGCNQKTNVKCAWTSYHRPTPLNIPGPHRKHVEPAVQI